jgi:hypothetical protein
MKFRSFLPHIKHIKKPALRVFLFTDIYKLAYALVAGTDLKSVRIKTIMMAIARTM